MKTKILLIAALLILSSCSFFRVIPESPYTAQSIGQYVGGKYLVLHRGDEAWHAYDLVVANDSLYAKLDLQLGYHIKYLAPKEKGLNQFDRRSEPGVVNSVHIYTSDTTFNSFDSIVSIPLSSINGVNVYEYARAPSRASLIVPIVVLPVGILVGVVVYSLSHMFDDFSMSY